VSVPRRATGCGGKQEGQGFYAGGTRRRRIEGRIMAWTQAEVRELREGRYMLVDDEPCRILSIQTSKPGKHGEAKARIDLVGLFDGSKRSVVFPVKHKVQVPIINKGTAQVLALTDTEVQLMDMQNYETFTLPLEPGQREQLSPGQEVPYMSAMGRRKIQQP
jgi:translation initiation factor 5A